MAQHDIVLGKTAELTSFKPAKIRGLINFYDSLSLDERVKVHTIAGRQVFYKLKIELERKNIDINKEIYFHFSCLVLAIAEYKKSVSRIAEHRDATIADISSVKERVMQRIIESNLDSRARFKRAIKQHLSDINKALEQKMSWPQIVKFLVTIEPKLFIKEEIRSGKKIKSMITADYARKTYKELTGTL